VLLPGCGCRQQRVDDAGFRRERRAGAWRWWQRATRQFQYIRRRVHWRVDVGSGAFEQATAEGRLLQIVQRQWLLVINAAAAAIQSQAEAAFVKRLGRIVEEADQRGQIDAFKRLGRWRRRIVEPGRCIAAWLALGEAAGTPLAGKREDAFVRFVRRE